MASTRLQTLGRWLRRIGLGLLAVVVLATIGGAIYEARGRSAGAERFPPPGTRVDIGGRSIHVDCRGSGVPVVVFEAGLDTYGSLSWARVHDSVAAFTRACAYDRAGVMWSDPATGVRDGAAIARDLHAALAAAGVAAPRVLVGHSLGGPLITTYTGLYPSEVAGLVYVDASHPAQLERFAAAIGKPMPVPNSLMLKAAVALDWTGLPRAIWPAPPDNFATGAPRAAALALSPRGLHEALAEADALAATLHGAAPYTQLGDRPVVVLTGLANMQLKTLGPLGLDEKQIAAMRGAWLQMHEEEAKWSTRGVHRVYEDAGHYVQLDRPADVVTAVREVVDAARGTGK